MREEIDQVIGSKNDITYEDVCKLNYTSNVLKETLRLWPPANILDRVCTEDFLINDKKVYKNSWVQVCNYVSHRNPKYFDNPSEFRPERFDNKEK
jgi:cytochrome P450